MTPNAESDAGRLKRIHHKTCLLYDYDPRLTKGVVEDRDCRCPDTEPHPCGHALVTVGCGGCDPGAIEFVITDDGEWRPFDPVLDTNPGLPDCEGWTCQSCGADNFIPDGFARVTPPEATAP